MAQELRGAWDTHVHAAPDVVARRFTFLEAAAHARAAGMAGIVLKDLTAPSVDRAVAAAESVDGELEVIGGIVLDLSVGGLNPFAVEASLARGARIVWMPVVHARNTVVRYRRGLVRLVVPPSIDESSALTVLDRQNHLFADVRRIVELIAAHDAVLATGHLGVEESLELLAYAASHGVRRLLVNHPASASIGASLTDQAAMAATGAFLEHCYAQTTEGLEALPPSTLVDAINAIGHERCVLGSDLGQVFNPPVPEGLLAFREALLSAGATLEQLHQMMVSGPSALFRWA